MWLVRGKGRGGWSEGRREGCGVKGEGRRGWCEGRGEGVERREGGGKVMN